MSKSLYLINPKADMPSYYGAEVVAASGLQPAVNVADLTLPTVAALAPDSFRVQLCDESVAAVDLESQADFVGITGKSTQVKGMLRLAQHFRQQGKIVIIGGPFATLTPETVRPCCDILVRGEIELIAPQLFADLHRGRWQAEYVGGQPDLCHSPIPRWDLYPNDRALLATIQTSRGCPFECEFCDVIQYAGRKQRHKPIDQVLAELDVLANRGYRAIFLADDNLTVHRRRAKELLAALVAWNERRTDDRVHFVSQVSIDTGSEDDILSLAAAAGLREVFVGIETPNEESLREVRKHQNVGVNLQAQVQRFLDHGISVTGGMIVGFDADGPDIFERQYNFAMSTPIPIFSVSLLVAPNATPLYSRLEHSGRLTPGTQGAEVSLWQTNIIPAGMTQAQLMEGIRWLVNELYHPQAFGRRVLAMIESLGLPDSTPPAPRLRTLRTIDGDILTVLLRLRQLGAAEAAMVANVTRVAAKKPFANTAVMTALFRYAQIRYMCQYGNFWDNIV